jgi:uncharacterized caspase-like protein
VGRLGYAVADARSFVETARSSSSALYDQAEPTLLLDGDATAARVQEEIAALAGRAGPEDAVLIYLAGHGVTARDGAYHFVTSEVSRLDGIERHGLGHDRLVSLLAAIPARRVFLFLDTCYSGGFDLVAPGNLANESGRYVLTASARYQEALDSYDGRNGVFAFAVLEALRGKAGTRGDVVDAVEMGLYVRDRVPALAQEKRYRQSAVFKVAGGDVDRFPVAARPD